jgi:hypothetical protein
VSRDGAGDSGDPDVADSEAFNGDLLFLQHLIRGKMGTGSVAQVGVALAERLSPRRLSPFSRRAIIP